MCHLRRPGAWLALAFVAACSACSRPPPTVQPPDEPGSAALLLLRLARETPEDEVWTRVVERGRIAADPVLFRTSVASLRRFDAPARVLRIEPLDALGRAAVDLECRVAGKGVALLTIQTERLPSGTWRVMAIDGPGVSWPASRAASEEGLTTSAPP